MHTANDLLTAAQLDPYQHVHALLTNPHTPPAALTALADAFNRVGIHDHTAAAIASHRNAPTVLTAAAATHPNPHVRRIIAESPHTPNDLLDNLTGDPHPLVATAAATNPHTPAGTLTRIGRDQNTTDLQAVAVAGNRATDPDTLAYLATHHNTYVRRAVAANPHTPPTALAHLAEADTNAAYHVAANPNTNLDTLKHLAETTEHQRTRERVHDSRRLRNQHIGTHTADAALAALLAPAFTGWPDQLTETITAINKPPHT